MYLVLNNRRFTSPFNSVFGDFFDRSLSYSNSLKTDIVDKGEAFVIKIDLPGATKDALSVKFKDSLLTVKLDVSSNNYPDQASTILEERYSGDYSRSFKVPTTVNIERISSTLINGVLEITLPKKEPVIPKEIDIKVG